MANLFLFGDGARALACNCARFMVFAAGQIAPGSLALAGSNVLIAGDYFNVFIKCKGLRKFLRFSSRGMRRDAVVLCAVQI